MVGQWGQPGFGNGEIEGGCDLSVDGAGNEYIFSCEPDRTQVFDPQHRLIGGAYAPPRDHVFAPVFRPNGEVYASDWFATDNIYILTDSLLAP